MEYRHAAPASSAPSRARTLISALVAFLLLWGLVPFSATASTQAAADEPPNVPVFLHFKDANGETVDFTQYAASFTCESNTMLVSVGDRTDALNYRDNLRFSVYDRYASFNGKQRDITDECSYDPESGLVSIPATYQDRAGELGIVFWLSPTHPAYERFIASQLITDDVSFTHDGQSITLQSDVDDIERTATGKEQGGSPLARSASFPGKEDKHYQLNPYTRLEEFDRDQTKKQKAYGFPSSWIGSYCFGAMFGAHRTFDHSVISSETNWNAAVLDKNDASYDEAVESYLSDTIAARLGKDATFATSMGGTSYRERCVTLGVDYQDDGYIAGSSPAGKAIARGICGSADINNGGGTPVPKPGGDNYITFKGIYDGPQTEYAGWYTFYFKFDTKSGWTGDTFQDIVGYLLTAPETGGNAQLTKVSAEPSISGNSGNYALEHGVFAAFASETAAKSALAKAQANTWKTWQSAQSWAEKNAPVAFVTDKSGKSPVVEDIEEGRYYVVELFAPKGFRLSSAVKPLDVHAAENDKDICAVTFEDTPQSGSIDVLKVSANPELTNGNSCYSLAKATYGIFTDAACLKPFREVVTALDENGNAYGRADKLPIGSYWVKETKRPAKGYALDARVYPVKVTDQKITRVNAKSVADNAKLDPLEIMLQKKDAQTGENAPQGAATLGDARFRINYYDVENGTAETVAELSPHATWLVRTDDTGAFQLQNADQFFTHTDKLGTETKLPYTISGSKFHRLSNGQIAMPLGTYTIQEVQAPEGYLLDSSIHVRHITDKDSDDEVAATFQLEEDNDKVADRVARSDLKLMKRADGAAKLTGIPFKITSKTTGEWHVIVTDKNGMASTQATAAHPHSARTNGNDEQFRTEDGSFQVPLVVDTSVLDASAGTWFGLASDGRAVDADDSLGALPFDTYEIEEIRCPANMLFQMIRDEIVVDETDDGLAIDLGTLNNTAEGKPSIRTSAYDGTSNDPYDREIFANEAASVVDRVSYTGLTPGETYTLQTILMDKATGEPFLSDGTEVVATTEFTPTDYSGYANATLSFNASSITGQTELVVFETLLQNDTEIASHRDLEDRQQTIVVNPVSIATTAVDSESKTHEGAPAKKVTIIDTVAYQGLVPGHEYRLAALLMNKGTGEPVTVDGSVVTVEKTFTPEASEGTTEVSITIPGENLDGAALVVFESLYYEDRELAIHADLRDEGQTVSYTHPDAPLTPTDEEKKTPEPDKGNEKAPDVSRPLAQTGDAAGALGLLLAAFAFASITIATYTHRKHRAPRE